MVIPIFFIIIFLITFANFMLVDLGYAIYDDIRCAFIGISVLFIVFTVFGFIITYNFVPNYFKLLNADGTLEI